MGCRSNGWPTSSVPISPSPDEVGGHALTGARPQAGHDIPLGPALRSCDVPVQPHSQAQDVTRLPSLAGPIVPLRRARRSWAAEPICARRVNHSGSLAINHLPTRLEPLGWPAVQVSRASKIAAHTEPCRNRVGGATPYGPRMARPVAQTPRKQSGQAGRSAHLDRSNRQPFQHLPCSDGSP